MAKQETQKAERASWTVRAKSALRYDGTSPMPVHRMVVCQHDLNTDEIFVTLIVDGEMAVKLYPTDWETAQQEAIRLLGDDGHEGEAPAS